MKNNGLLIVFSGPSGAGKDTILKHLLERNQNIKLSVSATTRAPRHAGDSRAYLITLNDSIKQLTTDHSMVQEMVNNGDITEQQAKKHPQKNIITRALGVESSIQIDYCENEFRPDCLLLICTDGLSNYVDAEQIFDFSGKMDAESMTDQLVMLAKNGGGSDNITVVTIEN